MRNLVYNLIALAIVGYVYANSLRYEGDVDINANGINTTESLYQYAISLQHLNRSEQALDTRGHRCGGALISFSHALTSASCLHKTVDEESVLIRPNEYRVFAGSILLTNDTGSTTQPTPDTVRMIANIAIHPNYIGKPSFVNDIGVIRLATPFAATTVRPLSLPADDFHPADFTPCQVAGWGGKKKNDTASTSLRIVSKFINNQDMCTMLTNIQVWQPNVLPSMVCATSYDLRSVSCVHDDGNALVCGGTFTGILVVHHDCDGTAYPELYTRVSNYTRWIRSISASPALFTPAVLIMTTLFSITQIFFN